jgi:hypothetical protein
MDEVAALRIKISKAINRKKPQAGIQQFFCKI